MTLIKDDAVKVTKYGILNDIHGPYHDPMVTDLVIDVMEDQLGAGDCLILNGDIFDFGNICRHKKNHQHFKWPSMMKCIGFKSSSQIFESASSIKT